MQVLRLRLAQGAPNSAQDDSICGEAMETKDFRVRRTTLAPVRDKLEARGKS
jgi:hypothetical protein